MKEIIFLVEEEQDGTYSARAVDYSIYTQGDTWNELIENIKDAVKCHFDEEELPRIIHVHMVKDVTLVL
ncbi:MAG: 2-oxoisovalerate dehydrogenase [Thermotoga sp.]|nr:MAG: 2-oxoisovalerate dehydrogenase [Thermotoga sp.]HDM70482.1 2-oxoisovalerate dehydrogenase [Thermotogales bacterium]